MLAFARYIISVQYTRGCSVHWGISWVYWGIAWVHWRISWLMWGKVIGKTIEFVWKPQCTQVILEHSSWYLPSVLIIFSGVLHIPQCTAQACRVFWQALGFQTRCSSSKLPPLYFIYDCLMAHDFVLHKGSIRLILILLPLTNLSY